MNDTIVQVIGNGDPGGGTTAVLTLALMLRQASHDVLIVSQSGSYLLDEAARLGIPAQGFDFSSRAGAIASFASLARLIRQRRPAVLHAHGNRAGLPCALAMHLLGKHERPRFVYTVHGFHFRLKQGAAFHLGRMAEKYCIGRAHWTNFVSQGDAAIAAEHGLMRDPAHTRVIHNAVLDQDFPKPFPPRSAGSIAFIGRITHPKQPLIVPEIIAALRPLVPLVPLVHVVGGGELEQALHARVRAMGLEAQFVFHGQQHRSATLSLAAACSMLLLPSLWEGHPITAIEAMQMGMPVIASDIPGTREIVQDQATGFLVPVGDVAAYAAVIARLLRQPGLAVTMGEAGRARALADFSPQQMLAANLAVYQLAAHGASAAPVAARA